MSNNYVALPSQVKEEENFPPHVKRKLKAYENAGLKYLINNDSIMKRDIIFEAKKNISPSSYEMEIQRIFRLRDQSGKEHIIYETLEKCKVEGEKFDCNIDYGIDEYIEADDVTAPGGGFGGRAITLHENKYTIDYTPEKLKSIFNLQKNKNTVPHMFLAETHNTIDAKYSGSPTRINDRNNFITMPYDDLMLMALTRTATMEDANLAAKVIREEKSMLPEGSDKLRILEASKNINNRTKK